MSQPKDFAWKPRAMERLRSAYPGSVGHLVMMYKTLAGDYVCVLDMMVPCLDTALCATRLAAGTFQPRSARFRVSPKDAALGWESATFRDYFESALAVMRPVAYGKADRPQAFDRRAMTRAERRANLANTIDAILSRAGYDTVTLLRTKHKHPSMHTPWSFAEWLADEMAKSGLGNERPIYGIEAALKPDPPAPKPGTGEPLDPGCVACYSYHVGTQTVSWELLAESERARWRQVADGLKTFYWSRWTSRTNKLPAEPFHAGSRESLSASMSGGVQGTAGETGKPANRNQMRDRDPLTPSLVSVSCPTCKVEFRCDPYNDPGNGTPFNKCPRCGADVVIFSRVDDPTDFSPSVSLTPEEWDAVIRARKPR